MKTIHFERKMNSSFTICLVRFVCSHLLPSFPRLFLYSCSNLIFLFTIEFQFAPIFFPTFYLHFFQSHGSTKKIKIQQNPFDLIKFPNASLWTYYRENSISKQSKSHHKNFKVFLKPLQDILTMFQISTPYKLV